MGHGRPERRTGAARNERGFSLVELVAASVILLVGVLGVAAITRTGREVDIGTEHRRAARSVIVSRFEGPQFHYTQYQNLLLSAGNATATSNVTVDDRGTTGTGDDLTGTLGISVGAQQTVSSGGIDVPYIPVTMTLAWIEPEGPDTVTLEKWITQ